MALGTLIFAAIAALAAVAAVVLPMWQQRPRLELHLTKGFSASGGSIDFPIRIENIGAAPIYQIELSAVGPDEGYGAKGNLGTFTLQPGEFRDVSWSVARPDRVDLAAGEIAPTFKVAHVTVAKYGRHEKTLVIPAGPSTF